MFGAHSHLIWVMILTFTGTLFSLIFASINVRVFCDVAKNVKVEMLQSLTDILAVLSSSGNNNDLTLDHEDSIAKTL